MLSFHAAQSFLSSSSSSTSSDNPTTDYHILQHNGQRILTFPRAPAPPARGSEVFVGNLPRDLFEVELLHFFLPVGPVALLRLMMDFTGQTRGFAFVTFCTVEGAEGAVVNLNDKFIRPNSRLTVSLSVNNCRLFFGCVPPDHSAAEVRAELGALVEGISDVIVHRDVYEEEEGQTRGYAFVEFESHAKAAIARRKLLGGIVVLWGHGHKVAVEWAKPEPVVRTRIMQQVTVLYFRNIPLDCTMQYFKQLLINKLGAIRIVRCYKKFNYAFVHFADRESADVAFRKLKNTFWLIEGNKIEIDWARPQNYRPPQQGDMPESFYMSVPPIMRKIVRSFDHFNKYNNNSSPSSDSNSGGDSFESI